MSFTRSALIVSLTQVATYWDVTAELARNESAVTIRGKVREYLRLSAAPVEQAKAGDREIIDALASTPSVPATTDSSTLSVSICRAMRHRLTLALALAAAPL